MRIGIIDIGSNSVRLALSADGKTLYKRLTTTRLGEGLSLTGRISSAAIERTAKAVSDYKKEAERDGAEKVYAFATASVRSASNGSEFTEFVKEHYGIDIEVISGETEAQIALLGALGNSDGGIIDLGGASCEVTVREGGNVIYSKSVDVGAVRLLDTCGRDRDKLEMYIAEKLKEYGKIDCSKYCMYGVSGTATSLGASKHKLKVYDPAIVHGTILTAEVIGAFADLFLNLTVEQIKSLGYVSVWRADVIGGASLYLFRLMQYMNISQITVSENDNLEGYLLYKGVDKV